MGTEEKREKLPLPNDIESLRTNKRWYGASQRSANEYRFPQRQRKKRNEKNETMKKMSKKMQTGKSGKTDKNVKLSSEVENDAKRSTQNRKTMQNDKSSKKEN